MARIWGILSPVDQTGGVFAALAWKAFLVQVTLFQELDLTPLYLHFECWRLLALAEPFAAAGVVL